MSSEQSEFLVIRDKDNNLYAIPEGEMSQYQVASENESRFRELLAAQEDVQGFAVAPPPTKMYGGRWLDGVLVTTAARR